MESSALFLGTSAGDFTAAAGLTANVPAGGAQSAIVADFTGDQILDIFVFGRVYNQDCCHQLLIGDGANFDGPNFVEAHWDGPNFVEAHWDGPNFVEAANDGSGVYQVSRRYGTGSGKNNVPVAADLDNDGDIDLFFGQRYSPFSLVFANDGTGKFSAVTGIPLVGVTADGGIAHDVRHRVRRHWIAYEYSGLIVFLLVCLLAVQSRWFARFFHGGATSTNNVHQTHLLRWLCSECSRLACDG